MRDTKSVRSAAGALAGVAFACLLVLVGTAEPAHATTIVPACARTGSADLACAMQTFRNVAALILGVTGSFALLMFVYGGFTLLTSGGAEQKVTKGKEIIRNAVIGIFLIILAGYIIDYAVGLLRTGYYKGQAGQACADGRGQWTQVSGGGPLQCIYTSCTGIADFGYECMAASDGHSCVRTLSGCGSGTGGTGGATGQGCCIRNPPEAPSPTGPGGTNAAPTNSAP